MKAMVSISTHFHGTRHLPSSLSFLLREFSVISQNLDPTEPIVVRLAPEPIDSRWDPETLPDDEADDEPRWTELQIASRKGDLRRVNKILSQCEDAAQRRDIVNARPVGWYGQTALQAACFHEHEEVVRALLEAGADISAPGGNNIYRNAFEYACGTGKDPS